MHQNFYEHVVLFKSSLTSDEIASIVKKIEDAISSKNGKVIRVEDWGLKDLAYKVNKHKRAFFKMFVMEATGEVISHLEKLEKIDENILRFLTVKFEGDDINEPSIQMKKIANKKEKITHETQ